MRTKNIWTYINIFTTYIRPILEFNSPIWSPHLLFQIQMIEKIQRNYRKRAFERCGIPFTNYQDRLKKINLFSLADRRKFLDLIFMYKLINGHYATKLDAFFHYKSTPYSLRSHKLQVSVNQSFQLSQWSGSFFNRVPKLWNELPEKVVCSDSIINFKKLLKVHMIQSN